MTDYPATRGSRRPTHPGLLLKDVVLPASGVSISDFAAKIEVSRQALHRILAGKASVTPEMAVKLGKLCGNGPHLWLNMQMAYDLFLAQEKLKPTLARIPTLKAA